MLRSYSRTFAGRAGATSDGAVDAGAALQHEAALGGDLVAGAGAHQTEDVARDPREIALPVGRGVERDVESDREVGCELLVPGNEVGEMRGVPAVRGLEGLLALIDQVHRPDRVRR